jgi:hypothetical protein
MSRLPHNSLPDIEPPVPLHERAADNLLFIREAMSRASQFTAVPGKGTALMGLVALVGGAIAVLRLSTFWWINTWCIVAALAGTLGVSAVALKARRTSTPLLSGAGRRMVGNFAPPVVAGAVLTLLFHNLSLEPWLPGMWMLMYGAGVVCAGAFSVPVVPVMGSCFMALGVLTLGATQALQGPVLGALYAGDIGMALGFGVMNIVFGFIIARHYGG